MEALEEAYGDDQNVRINAVITIVEVITTGETDEDGKVQITSSNVRMRHNVADPYRVVGLLEQAAFGVLAP
jgi:hypothetical protein